MKKQILLSILSLFPLVVNAYDVLIDGIYYNLDSSQKTAEVTSKVIYENSTYSGDITIPNKINYNNTVYTVTSVGEYSFYNCKELISVKIPSSVNTIGHSAFRGCSSLNNISIPNSVTTINGEAFMGCSSLTSMLIPDNVTIIRHSTFRDCSKLTTVYIPNGVTSIEGLAFLETKLTSITIPSSVQNIDPQAFSGCNSVSSLTVNCKEIDIWFESLYNIKELFIGKNVSTLYNNLTTTDTKNLISINVDPNNSIYDSRNNCNALIETSTNKIIKGCINTQIPNDIKIIGVMAFANYSTLKSIAIPNSVTTIEAAAFSGCEGLQSITIPNSVTSIGRVAFQKCTNLTSVEIPNSVKTIGEFVFENCTKLNSVIIPTNWTSIENGLFCDCKGLTSITIPEGVTTIGNFAFERCSSLASVSIPNRVYSIGKYAFWGCSGLTSITLPKSITNIGEKAFDKCSGITSYTCFATTPPRGTGYTNYTTPLYVPKGCVLQYKIAEDWQNFVNIYEISDIHLIISDGAHGCTKIIIDRYNPYVSLKLEAEEGWSIYSVMLNDEDVTSEITEDGTYNTPAINADSKLSIIYSQDETSVRATSHVKLKVTSTDNTLTIQGLENGTPVSVYSLDGKCIISTIATEGYVIAPVTKGQSYILKANGQALKFAAL